MNNKILFSPLGKTDPTRDNFDGAFLHILRHYQPSKAYLYLTAEICKYDEKDNRYEIMAKKLLPDCSIIKFRHPEIDNPQEFEIFYKQFEEILKEIKQQNPNSDIILNLSSGTPQMKSALHLLCVMSRSPLTAIQVLTPAKKGNESKPVGEDYDINQEWINLIDNIIEFEPEMRCKIVKFDNAWALIAREIISSHIVHYDYRAAFITAELVKEFIGERVINLLQAGERRLALDFNRAQILSKKADFALFPVESSHVKEIFEYLLYLLIKIKRGELADFTRGVSPVISDLFEMYLKEQCKVDISLYCKNKHGIKILSKELLPSDINNYFNLYFTNGGYRDTFLSSTNMLPYIIFLKGNHNEAVKLAEELREFEKRTRNVAAHEIQEVSNDWLKKKVGMTADQVFNKLKKFYQLTFPTYAKKEFWNSYDILNDKICKQLNIS